MIGLEISEAQIGVARFMLASTEARRLRFHPFLDEPRNAHDARSRAASYEAPDVAPRAAHRCGGATLRLEHGDFMAWRPASGASCPGVAGAQEGARAQA